MNDGSFFQLIEGSLIGSFVMMVVLLCLLIITFQRIVDRRPAPAGVKFLLVGMALGQVALFLLFCENFYHLMQQR
jgi:hypothetical protein